MADHGAQPAMAMFPLAGKGAFVTGKLLGSAWPSPAVSPTLAHGWPWANSGPAGPCPTAGIRVNAVCPGTVITPMEPADGEEAAIEPLVTEVGRTASVEDLVGAYHFLAADEGQYMSGQTIVVDGEWSAGLNHRAHGISASGLTLEVEPGRACYAGAGIHLSRVVNVKSETQPVPLRFVEIDTTEMFLPDTRIERQQFQCPAAPGDRALQGSHGHGSAPGRDDRRRIPPGSWLYTR